MEMASALSVASWYDYTIHNIFNVANFIEYESYPKRRKLDNSNRYHTAENLTSSEYELDSNSRVRSHQVIYRPYSGIQQQHDSVKHKLSKKAYKRQRDNEVGLQTQTEEENRQQPGTSIDKLYPELLCLIFEKLDLQSKGRVAQVNRLH